MAAARLGSKRAVIGRVLTNSHPGCITNKALETLLSHCRWMISGREACLGSENADCCMISYELM